MRSVKILKPQPSPTNSGRQVLSNITNTFMSRRHEVKDFRQKSQSPKSQIHFDKQNKRVYINKLQNENKFMNYNYKCVNHKDKRGKFQLENNHDASYYCDNCAVELSLKGHRLLTINQTEMTNKMANQANQYIKVCDEIINQLSYKLNQITFEKGKLERQYEKMKADIEQQKLYVIKTIEQKYERQLMVQAEEKKIHLSKFDEQESKIKKLQKQFDIIKGDIRQNIKDINVNIEVNEFRQIMDIYWSKINNFNQTFLKINYQLHYPLELPLYINRYGNNISRSRIVTEPAKSMKTFEETLKQLRNKDETRLRPEKHSQFTFSKRLYLPQTQCVQSFESNQQQSRESIVSQRFGL